MLQQDPEYLEKWDAEQERLEQLEKEGKLESSTNSNPENSPRDEKPMGKSTTEENPMGNPTGKTTTGENPMGTTTSDGGQRTAVMSATSKKQRILPSLSVREDLKRELEEGVETPKLEKKKGIFRFFSRKK